MWELDCEESWAPKNGCFWTVVLEKSLESPLDCKEIQPVNPKEINPEYSLEGLMLMFQYTLATWCEEMTHWKNLLIGKDPDAGKGWRQEEKVEAKDGMVR